MDKNYSKMPDIDVNSPDFYKEVQFEIDSDLARMKKTIEVVLNLRLTVAETEVETAALYHAELWQDILNMNESLDITSDEETGCEDDVAVDTQPEPDKQD